MDETQPMEKIKKVGGEKEVIYRQRNPAKAGGDHPKDRG